MKFLLAEVKVSVYTVKLFFKLFFLVFHLYRSSAYWRYIKIFFLREGRNFFLYSIGINIYALCTAVDYVFTCAYSLFTGNKYLCFLDRDELSVTENSAVISTKIIVINIGPLLSTVVTGTMITVFKTRSLSSTVGFFRRLGNTF